MEYGMVVVVIAFQVGSAMSHQRDSKEEISSLAFNDESLRNVAKFFNFYETNCMDTYQKLREANEKIRILDEKLKKLNPEDSSKQKCEKSSRFDLDCYRYKFSI